LASICLADYLENDSTRSKGEGHPDTFRRKCLEEWLIALGGFCVSLKFGAI